MPISSLFVAPASANGATPANARPACWYHECGAFLAEGAASDHLTLEQSTMTLKRWTCAALFAAASFAVPAFAQNTAQPKPAPTQVKKPPEDPRVRKGPEFLTIESAPKCYAYQGEYVPVGAAKVGVQIISLGARDKTKPTFRAVIHKGGLPGDGYDLSPKTQVDGNWDGDNIKFGDTLTLLPGGKGTLKLDGGTVELKRVVRQSPTLGAKAPAGAVVLFDGSNTDAWAQGKLTEQKVLQVPCLTKEKFKDFQLHIEFMSGYMPEARGQDRGNSGVYLQQRYEIQVLDSFGLTGEDNECGGIYKTAKPKVNMCFPPLTWQTYDVDYTAPKYDGEKKVAKAKVTIKHNGVTIMENQEIDKETGGGQKETNTPGALYVQGHGDTVFVKNVWIVPK